MPMEAKEKLLPRESMGEAMSAGGTYPKATRPKGPRLRKPRRPSEARGALRALAAIDRAPRVVHAPAGSAPRVLEELEYGGWSIRWSSFLTLWPGPRGGLLKLRRHPLDSLEGWGG